MSTPVLWILAPAGLGLVLYLLRSRERLAHLLGTGAALFLALLAWQLPIDELISLGPWSIRLADTLEVLGRRFVLDDASRPLLIFVYLSVGLWFGAARAAHTSRLFVPAGMVMAALLVAALAVEPFLYAALLMVMAVMVSVPLLSPPGHPTGRGVLRYLTFMVLGMPFMLFAGWLIEGSDAGPLNPELLLPAAMLLALGFAFFAAVFPFHSWVPVLAEEAHPYAAGFVFFLLPGVVSLFGLEFYTRYAWLNTTPIIFAVLRTMGVLMVVIGGVWAAFQRNLPRMLGFTVMVETGLSLLALSLPVGAGSGRIETFVGLLLPRGVSLAVWALALTLIREHTGGELYFRNVQGLVKRLPAASAGLLLGHFSLAGFPMLAGFPIQVALETRLAAESLPVALLVLAGHAGLLACGIRTMGVLVNGRDEEPWRFQENGGQIALLAIGSLAILLLGLLPQWFMPALMELANRFAGV